jgi:hypothetical protein
MKFASIAFRDRPNGILRAVEVVRRVGAEETCRENEARQNSLDLISYRAFPIL